MLRHRELKDGCAPFVLSETSRALAAMTAMFQGFRSMRHDDDVAAAAALHGLRRVLSPFPLWAIKEGCEAIHDGIATLDGKALSKAYPANDAEIRAVIAGLVKPFEATCDAAAALLSAPVMEAQPVEPKPTLNEMKQKYGENFGLTGLATATPAATDIPKIDASRFAPADIERLTARLDQRRSAAAVVDEDQARRA